MQKTQENKFTMYNAVNAFLDENRELAELNSGLNSKKNEFFTKCSEIKATEETKRTAMSGRSASKLLMKNRAITGCFNVTAALYSLGSSNNDLELKSVTNMQRSELQYMRDTELIEVLESVHSMAEARLTALEAHGLTAATLGSYKQTVEAYSKAFGRIQTGKLNKKDAGVSLTDLFKYCDSLLAQMDKYVEGMKDDQTEFARKYKDARKIKRFGIRYEKDETQNQTSDTPTAPVISSPPEDNGPPVTG